MELNDDSFEMQKKGRIRRLEGTEHSSRGVRDFFVGWRELMAYFVQVC